MYIIPALFCYCGQKHHIIPTLFCYCGQKHLWAFFYSCFRGTSSVLPVSFQRLLSPIRSIPHSCWKAAMGHRRDHNTPQSFPRPQSDSILSSPHLKLYGCNGRCCSMRPASSHHVDPADTPPSHKADTLRHDSLSRNLGVVVFFLVGFHWLHFYLYCPRREKQKKCHPCSPV